MVTDGTQAVIANRYIDSPSHGFFWSESFDVLHPLGQGLLLA